MRYTDEVRNRSHPGPGHGALAYTILTMCRALRTVRLGAVGSKQEAADWVRGRMPEYAWLVDKALESRRSGGIIGLADQESRAAAETFIKLVADEISRHTGHEVRAGRLTG